MARILLATGGWRGLLYSGVELARRLAAAGHELHFAAPPEARELVERHGLHFHELPPDRSAELARQDAETSALTRLRSVRARREAAAEATGARAFARQVRELSPALVLLDAELHEHVVTASATGARLALLNTFRSLWRLPGLPPLHHDVVPGVGWRGSRPSIAALWLALRARKLGRAARLRLRRLGADRLAVLHLLAREAELDLAAETDAGHWPIPFTWRRLPVLTLHALEFEFPHEPPARERYVGPMLLEDRGEVQLPPELEAVLARCADRQRGLIYAGFGSTYSAAPGLPRRLVEAVAARPDWELVLSTGGREPAGELGALPPNAHAFRWLPQLELLRRADVAVVHGGASTMDECLAHGVPTLGYRGGHTDMAGNLARSRFHGAGLVGDARGDSPAEIRGLLERLLSGPAFRRAAEELGAAGATYARERVAERTVDELLAGSWPG